MRKVWWLSLLSFACSNSKSLDDPNELAERHEARLRECGVLSEGKFAVAIAPAYACFSRCLVAASCGEIRRAACREGDEDSKLLHCYERCEEGEPRLICRDGSSTEATRCDGNEECKDGSDEDSCSRDADFVCDDDESISERYTCDGTVDCQNGRDEEDCGRPSPKPLFVCKDGERIWHDLVECDGFEDCSDGSDEIECVERGLAFACKDGEFYVPITDVCNDYLDCDDRSDEEGCAEIMCPLPDGS